MRRGRGTSLARMVGEEVRILGTDGSDLSNERDGESQHVNFGETTVLDSPAADRHPSNFDKDASRDTASPLPLVL